GRPTDGPDAKGAIVAADRSDLCPLVGSGRVRPIVHERIPVTEVSRAHEAMDAGGVVGKLLLLVRDE
ncbi:zinc-binding dehydrogenase, partial [Escherichia coli]|uniref:zinc-binding dehydrogenase n=1 Tax=Escherichia coli TaxID=562 RepID=UPI001932C11B